jgi:hypothetical protein
MEDRYREYGGRGARYEGERGRADRDRDDRGYRNDDRDPRFEDARGWARDDEEPRGYERPRERPYDPGGRSFGGRRFGVDVEQARREAGRERVRWQRDDADSRTHSRDTDYSGMSFGGGHRTDRHVYPPGAGLEAGYMAPPQPAYWEGPARHVADRDDVGEGMRYRERPREPRASWLQRSSHGPYAGRGPKNYQRSDERIREELNERLTAHGHVDATDIECQVQNGEVTLSGYVNNRAEKHEAEDVAQDIAGVHDVHNRLRIRTSAGEEGVGRTSVLGLTESEAQNRSSAQSTEAAERSRTRR